MKKFRHYKGGTYEFIGEAIHSETKEKMVIYSDSDNNIYVRPAKMFYEEVKINGKTFKRFTELNNDN